MSGNKIITISREFGTGARLIGLRIATELGFDYYDRALIQLAADKSGLSPDFIEKNETTSRNSFLYNIATTAYVSSTINLQYTMPVNDKAFIAQSEVIKEVAAKGNCVILGRCADYVLSDYPKLMRVFLYGDRKDRLKRIIEDYGYDPQTAEEEMNKIDKGRAGYIKYYTGSVWTDHRTHDIMLNTSRCGIEGSVKVLLNFAEAFFKG
ncbi:MAG: cytidylate kinase-like family protein [Clostridiales bacterium]|nr:cytidylate kinase-like family protein [Clostridiales bacterium]